VSLQIIEIFTWKTWVFWYSDCYWHLETCSLNPVQTKLIPVRYRFWCWWILRTFLYLMLGTLSVVTRVLKVGLHFESILN